MQRKVSNLALPTSSGVYKITCTANKKIYIGSAVNLRRRKREHFNGLRQNKHRNAKLQNAWNKYGEQAFIFEVLELVLPIFLTAREQYWLNKHKPFGRRGFNIASEAGSALGVKRSPETIEKLRQANLGKKPSIEAIEAARQVNLGGHSYRRTPQTIEKVRQSNKGTKPSPQTIEAARQVNLGKPGYERTPEIREKARQVNLGRKHTPETCENMRQAHLGAKLIDGKYIHPLKEISNE